MSAGSKPNDSFERPRRARVVHSKEQPGYLVTWRNLFYLSLTMLVLLDLLDTAARFGQSFRTADVLAGVAPLDSVSEPAIAATLLRREADNLFSSFIEARNDAEYPGTAASHPELPSKAETPSDSIVSKPKEMSAPEIQVLQRLERLRVNIRQLNPDRQVACWRY